MFDFDKLLAKMMAPFVALLVVALCIWATVKVLELIWLQLLIILAAFSVIAACVFLLWLRFRRW